MDAHRDELLAHTILHADETPVAMLVPGKKQTQRAQKWAYAATRFISVLGVVYDFHITRSSKKSDTSSPTGKANLCVTILMVTGQA